ncbi:hypothetical protein [Mesorhizobium sp.]|uniref:hypothetical protein n=1 Tax=Mesorhizobium sp. TaxID=1871066 RepID=UPI003BAA265E
MRLSWFAISRDRKPPSAGTFHTDIIADISVPDSGETVRFFSRKVIHPGRIRGISNQDAREILLSAFYLAVAATVPLRWWAPICRQISRSRLKRHTRKRLQRYADSVHAVLGNSIDARKQFEDSLAARHRFRLQLAGHLVASRWSPTIRLEGIEGLQAALRRGHGAIIWCDQFTAQTIIGKRALYEAGIEAHQVSANTHGISNSVFGLRFLNPPLINVENRYLKSRIVFDRNEAYQVTIRIQKILRGNGVVLMTNTIHAGSTFTEVALGESGSTYLASAPANFAARNKVALFGMSTFEVAPFREYRAMLSAELLPAAPAASATGKIPDGAKNMALQAAYILLKRDALLRALKLYPEQMPSWSGLRRLTEDQDGSGIGTDPES